MAEVPFASNLLPQYQSPQAMMQADANTQNTLASTGLIGAQTQGANIANQSAALTLGQYQNAINGTGPSGTPAPPSAGGASTIGGTGVDPDDVTQTVISKYAPLPTARPPSVMQQMYQWNLAGKPEVAQSIGAQYDAQVAGVNQQRQIDASKSYQVAQQVDSAPAGGAFATLKWLNPDGAAKLQKQYPNDDPDQLDADTRLFAQHIGIATHQYTGRPTDFQNGVLVDKNDGAPVLGAKQVLTGLDAAGKEKAFASANELVTVPNSDGSTSQVPKWQKAGFSSAEGYVINADKAARSTANSPGTAPPASSNTPAPAPAPKANAAPGVPASAAPATTDPVMKTALADQDFKLKTPPVVAGRTPTPADLDQQKATVQARTDLLKDSGDATQAASQSLQYLNAAKQIMDTKGAAPVTGFFGPIRNEISRVYGGVDATNYQEVAKYLGNAALANAKGIYGPRMSTSEVELQLNDLSPSTHMTPDAINNLIGNNIKSAQYTIDSAKRSKAYLATGGDPQSFSQWNQQYFPREKTVGAPGPVERPGQQASGAVQTATGPNGQKLYLRNGQWAAQ